MGIFKPNVEKIAAKRDVNALIKLTLKHKNIDVSESAADALCKIKDEKVVELLTQALKNEHAYVRIRAADALGKIGDERSVEPLIHTLKDKNKDVRWWAARALGKIGDERSVEPLIHTLKDKNMDVRGWAADSLGMIGDERSVEPLIHTLKDKNKDVRTDVERALGNIGDAVLEPLICALKDNDWHVRASAAKLLGKVKYKTAVQPLIAVLQDLRHTVRVNAVDSLGVIKDERAVSHLINLLNEKDAKLKNHVKRALKQINTPAAINGINAIKKMEKEKIAQRQKVVPEEENFFGLSIVEGNLVKYNGPLQEVPLKGSGAIGVIKKIFERTPSVRLMLLPQLGLLILIESSNNYNAMHFKSSLSTDDTANISVAMIKQYGKRIKMIEKFGAIEYYD